MRTIDFKNIVVYTDIAKREQRTLDARESFANVLYQGGVGIAAHALAMKIYQSDGALEYDDKECALIKQYAESCQPFFIDAINTLLEVPQGKEA